MGRGTGDPRTAGAPAMEPEPPPEPVASPAWLPRMSQGDGAAQAAAAAAAAKERKEQERKDRRRSLQKNRGFSSTAALELAQQLNHEITTREEGIEATITSPYMSELRAGTDAGLRFADWHVEIEFLHAYLRGAIPRVRTVAAVGAALAVAWPAYLAWRCFQFSSRDVWARLAPCGAVFALVAAAFFAISARHHGAWLRVNAAFAASVCAGPAFLLYYAAFAASRILVPDGDSESEFPAASPFLLLALLALRIPLRVASYCLVAVLCLEMLALSLGSDSALGVLYWLALAEICGLLFVTAQGSEASSRRSFLLSALVKRARATAAHRARRLEALLANMLPEDVLAAVWKGELGRVNRTHSGASVVFVKLANIPQPTAAEAPRLIGRINRMMGELEDLCIAHRIQKIKSVGASVFLAVGGVAASDGAAEGGACQEPATNACRFGLAAISAGERLGFRVQVGIHVGPVVAGIIGSRLLYDVFGDTVNTAQRMCAHAAADGTGVHVSEAAAEAVRAESLGDVPPWAALSEVREIEVKGKGRMRTAYISRATGGEVGAGGFASLAPAPGPRASPPPQRGAPTPPSSRRASPTPSQQQLQLQPQANGDRETPPPPPVRTLIKVERVRSRSMLRREAAAAAGEREAAAATPEAPAARSAPPASSASLKPGTDRKMSIPSLQLRPRRRGSEPDFEAGPGGKRAPRRASVLLGLPEMRPAAPESQEAPAPAEKPRPPSFLARLSGRTGPFAAPAAEAAFWQQRAQATSGVVRALLAAVLQHTLIWPGLESGVGASSIFLRMSYRTAPLGIALVGLLAASFRPFFLQRQRLVMRCLFFALWAIVSGKWLADAVDKGASTALRLFNVADALCLLYFVNGVPTVPVLDAALLSALLAASSVAAAVAASAAGFGTDGVSCSPVWMALSAGAALSFAVTREREARREFALDSENQEETSRLTEQLHQTVGILELCLPTPVLELLQSDPAAAAIETASPQGSGDVRGSAVCSYARVAVLTSDIVGFTALSAGMTAEELVHVLSQVFALCDDIAVYHGVTFLKTIGDAWVGAVGLEKGSPCSAKAVEALLDCAVEMVPVYTGAEVPLHVRIGVGLGAGFGGVIGRRRWFWDLHGEAVSDAQRMEETAPPDSVHVTADVVALMGADHPRFRFDRVTSRLGAGGSYVVRRLLPPATAARRPSAAVTYRTHSLTSRSRQALAEAMGTGRSRPSHPSLKELELHKAAAEAILDGQALGTGRSRQSHPSHKEMEPLKPASRSALPAAEGQAPALGPGGSRHSHKELGLGLGMLRPPGHAAAPLGEA